jgi:hypothetical protein
MEFEKQFICKVCNKAFKDPVLLPCGNAICKRDVDGVDIFKCPYCNEQHLKPKEGFTVVKQIKDCLSYCDHVTKQRYNAGKLYDQWNKYSHRLERLNPDELINEFIHPIQEKIERRKKEAIDALERRISVVMNEYEIVSNDLQSKQNQYRMNSAMYKRLNFTKIREEYYAQMHEKDQPDYVDRVNKLVNEINKKIEKAKKELFQGELLDFEKNDKFGNLVVKTTSVKNNCNERNIDEYKEELNELRRKVAEMENGLAQLELDEN